MHKFMTYLIYTLFAALILGVVIYTIAAYQNVNYYDVIIEDKEVKRDGDSSKYLVFTKLDDGSDEIRVFQNTDALFVGKFSSSDIQGQLKVGERYEVKTIGFRIPFLSKYENIIKIDERVD